MKRGFAPCTGCYTETHTPVATASRLAFGSGDMSSVRLDDAARCRISLVASHLRDQTQEFGAEAVGLGLVVMHDGVLEQQV